ncbi:hypothetical protein ACFL2X_00755 [Candidatus Latescibacterota bacterium]
MSLRPVVIYTVLLFLSIFSKSLSADIDWKLFLNTSGSSPVLSTTTSDSDEFVINNDNISGGSGSDDILEALTETSFALSQPPNSAIEIHIILNVQGNLFQSVNGKALSLNMKIEAFSDGTSLNNMPMTMTIPSGTGLNALLELSDCPRSSIVFAYNNGGTLEKDGIETQSLSRGIVVQFNNLSTIVGGKNSSLGFPASVEFSTWYKIKTLFE